MKMFLKTPFPVILLLSILIYTVSAGSMRNGLMKSKYGYGMPGALMKGLQDGEFKVYEVKRSEAHIPEDRGLARFQIFRRRNS